MNVTFGFFLFCLASLVLLVALLFALYQSIKSIIPLMRIIKNINTHIENNHSHDDLNDIKLNDIKTASLKSIYQSCLTILLSLSIIIWFFLNYFFSLDTLSHIFLLSSSVLSLIFLNSFLISLVGSMKCFNNHKKAITILSWILAMTLIVGLIYSYFNPTMLWAKIGVFLWVNFGISFFCLGWVAIFVSRKRSEDDNPIIEPLLFILLPFAILCALTYLGPMVFFLKCFVMLFPILADVEGTEGTIKESKEEFERDAMNIQIQQQKQGLNQVDQQALALQSSGENNEFRHDQSEDTKKFK